MAASVNLGGECLARELIDKHQLWFGTLKEQPKERACLLIAKYALEYYEICYMLSIARRAGAGD